MTADSDVAAEISFHPFNRNVGGILPRSLASADASTCCPAKLGKSGTYCRMPFPDLTHAGRSTSTASPVELSMRCDRFSPLLVWAQILSASSSIKGRPERRDRRSQSSNFLRGHACPGANGFDLRSHRNRNSQLCAQNIGISWVEEPSRTCRNVASFMLFFCPGSVLERQLSHEFLNRCKCFLERQVQMALLRKLVEHGFPFAWG